MEQLATLIDAFLAHPDRSAGTREAYDHDIRVWLAWCARRDLNPLEVGPAATQRFRTAMIRAGLAASTINRRLSALTGLYALAVKRRVIPTSPMVDLERLAVGEVAAPTFGVADLQPLLTAAKRSSTRDHALACLLVLDGLKPGEVTAAKVEDVTFASSGAVLRRRDDADVPLQERTVAALRAYLDGRERGGLIVTRTGRPLDRQAITRTIRRLARAAGLDHVNPQSIHRAWKAHVLDERLPHPEFRRGARITSRARARRKTAEGADEAFSLVRTAIEVIGRIPGGGGYDAKRRLDEARTLADQLARVLDKIIVST